MTTFSEYSASALSRKAVLAKLQAARRISGFSVYSGSVYVLEEFDYISIVMLEANGTALAEVASVALVTAGKFFNDVDAKKLYVRCADDANPNSKFLALTFNYFFSNMPAKVHENPSSATGRVVFWNPLMVGNSLFSTDLDVHNIDQIGNAIEGSGTLEMLNDQEFWVPIYDSTVFENKKAEIYSWSPTLEDGEAKLIFRGVIESRSYTQSKITFSLKDQMANLKSPVVLDYMQDLSGARISSKMNLYFQRRIYGRVFGHLGVSIDQVTEAGYPLTGTFSTTNGSSTLSGSGTDFLSELSPNDELLLDGDTDRITIGDVITSATSATLSEDFERASLSGVSAVIFPSRAKRYINREFLIAGHATRQPETTVTGSFGVRTIKVTSSVDMKQGDEIVVSGEVVSIQRVGGDGQTIKLAKTLTNPANIGDAVVRPSVTDVYIQDRKLVNVRDYTYEATTGKLTLDPLAEFNVAPVELVTGTCTFGSSSRHVTGSGTSFTKDFEPGDWIKSTSTSTWSEILYIEDDVSLYLRTNAGFTGSSQGQRKRPDIYNENTSKLSCNVLGKTKNGLKSGEFIETGAEIVADLIDDAGLTALIDTVAFTKAAVVAPYPLSLVIPPKATETKTKNVRDYVSLVNKSVLGALVQDSDFMLAYKIFAPRRPSGAFQSMDEHDIIGFKVKSDASRIVSSANVSYKFQEFNGPALGSTNLVYNAASKYGSYLTKTDKEFDLDSLLTGDGDAIIMARRISFLLSQASALITLNSKLQLIQNNITDTLKISHPKMYHRIGSSSNAKFGLIQSADKGAFGVNVEIEDLANAFSRCSVIVPTGSNNFANATPADILLSGFITDQFGLLNNDQASVEVNLIW